MEKRYSNKIIIITDIDRQTETDRQSGNGGMGGRESENHPDIRTDRYIRTLQQ